MNRDLAEESSHAHNSSEGPIILNEGRGNKLEGILDRKIEKLAGISSYTPFCARRSKEAVRLDLLAILTFLIPFSVFMYKFRSLVSYLYLSCTVQYKRAFSHGWPDGGKSSSVPHTYVCAYGDVRVGNYDIWTVIQLAMHIYSSRLPFFVGVLYFHFRKVGMVGEHFLSFRREALAFSPRTSFSAVSNSHFGILQLT